MNSVRFKKLCFGTLLKPDCWGCAVLNHQVVGGWVAVLLFCIIGWFNTAAWVGLFVILFMMYLIISPAQTYTMILSDKKLLVLVFNSDFFRRYRSDLRRKMSLVRIIAVHSDGHSEIIWKGKEVFGCDARFTNVGIFLFKPRLAFWGIVCDGFEFGRDLGWKVDDLLFDEKTSRNKKTLHFLTANSFVSLNVDSYDRENIFAYFFQTAKFKSLHNNELLHFVVGRTLYHLLCTIDGKNYLVGYHINHDFIPMAYFIIAPTIIWKHNGKDITLQADENGAFQLPKH